jgi:hypothetical protein
MKYDQLLAWILFLCFVGEFTNTKSQPIIMIETLLSFSWIACSVDWKVDYPLNLERKHSAILTHKC